MQGRNGMAAYAQLLRGSRAFSLILLGEVVNQAGTWFSYVATMQLVKDYGGGRGVLISGVIIARTLPAAVMFPAAGAVADRCNRVLVLMCSCLTAAATAASLVLVRSRNTLWIMYALLFVQFSLESFYDPARRALTTELVPRDQLHLSATLDGFVWSCMAAVGSAAGGVAVSKLGTRTCFLIDSGTYFVAACCALQSSSRKDGGEYSSLPSSDSLPHRASGNFSRHRGPSVERLQSGRDAAEHGLLGNGAAAPAAQSGAAEQRRQAGASTGGGGGGGGSGEAEHAAEEVEQRSGALVEGWRYISAPKNRDVAVFALIKASGALLWGASDVLYVKFADVPAMQVRDSATSLGIIYAAMGAGAIVGPLVANVFVPSEKSHLLRAVAFAFATLLAGYVAMAAAPTIAFLVPSVVLKSTGSSVLWVYSTLLLQLEADPAFQGRVFALEMAAYVLMETASSLWGGAMFDDLRFSTRSVALLMSGVSVLVTIAWTVYAWRKWDAAAAAAASRGGGGHSDGGQPDDTATDALLDTRQEGSGGEQVQGAMAV